MIEPTAEMRMVAYRDAREWAAARRHQQPDDRMIDEVLTAVLKIVERDYVSRWGSITQRVPREFMTTPSMNDVLLETIIDHAKYMGAEVVDIDDPEILPDDSPYAFGDYVAMKWKIRRIA